MARKASMVGVSPCGASAKGIVPYSPPYVASEHPKTHSVLHPFYQTAPWMSMGIGICTEKNLT